MKKCNCTPTTGDDGITHHHSECPRWTAEGASGHETNRNGASEDGTPNVIYATREEAERAYTAKGKERVYELARHGTVTGYTWARYQQTALQRASKQQGVTATLTSIAPVTEQAAASRVLQMTDEQLAAYGLSRRPAPAVVEPIISAADSEANSAPAMRQPPGCDCRPAVDDDGIVTHHEACASRRKAGKGKKAVKS